MNHRSRIRATILALTTVLSVAACGSSGSSPASSSSSASTATVRLGLVQAQDFIHAMPAQVAMKQGFFTQQGLNVSIVGFSSGSDLTKAMAGGSVDVGAATGLDAVSAAAHGIPLQAFYGVYAQSPMALIVPTASPVKGFADLQGKKVGISKAGSLTDFITRAALTAVKVPLTAVTEVPLGDPASTMTALDRGDIDAFVLPVNFGFVEQAQGKGKIAQMASDVLGSDSQFAILMAKSDFVSSNNGTLKKVAAAYKQALEWMKANKAGVEELAASKLGMKPAIADQTYTRLITGFTPDGAISQAGMSAYAKALPDLKIATTEPKESDYLTTSVVPGSSK
jgi:sulfonate transport system substrate-binding protein